MRGDWDLYGNGGGCEWGAGLSQGSAQHTAGCSVTKIDLFRLVLKLMDR